MKDLQTSISYILYGKSKKSEHWRFMVEHEGELAAKLGEQDVVLAGQTYKGPGVAGVFSVPKEVALVRLRRRDFEGHEKFKFQHRQEGDFLGIDAADYALFLPLIQENVRNIIKGRNFKFYSLNHIRESADGWVKEMDPAEVYVFIDSLKRLASQMPKIRVPKVTRTDLKVGDSLIPGVLSSNPSNDNGDIEIYSLKGQSSILYNPNAKKPFGPAVYWGPP